MRVRTHLIDAPGQRWAELSLTNESGQVNSSVRSNAVARRGNDDALVNHRLQAQLYCQELEPLAFGSPSGLGAIAPYD